MAKGKKTCAPAFKRRMVELVRAGRSPEDLGKEFEPSPNTSVLYSFRVTDAGCDWLPTEVRDP